MNRTAHTADGNITPEFDAWTTALVHALAAFDLDISDTDAHDNAQAFEDGWSAEGWAAAHADED